MPGSCAGRAQCAMDLQDRARLRNSVIRAKTSPARQFLRTIFWPDKGTKSTLACGKECVLTMMTSWKTFALLSEKLQLHVSPPHGCQCICQWRLATAALMRCYHTIVVAPDLAVCDGCRHSESTVASARCDPSAHLSILHLPCRPPPIISTRAHPSPSAGAQCACSITRRSPPSHLRLQ